MQPSDKIHALVNIFNWKWWQVALLIFVIDWFLIQVVIKRFEPLGVGRPLGKGKRVNWRSEFYGDLLLPLGVASSVVVLRDFTHTSTWYTGRWWNWVVLAAGYILVIVFDARAGYSRKQYFTPSKLWHTLIAFPLIFYMAGMTLIPLVVTHTPLWAVILAALAYLGWFSTVLMDFHNPPDVSII